MDIVLNTSSSETIYEQIFSQISSQIINGKLLPGEKLPSIRRISNQLGISVIPVKMAWEKLDEQGFIKTVAGSGTFVNVLQQGYIREKSEQKVSDLVKKIRAEAEKIGISKQMLINQIEKKWHEN